MHERYPRASKHDLEWVLDNEMGPNALWLLEGLCERLHLEAGMRVLDMGCGRAMTSIFLAKEYDVKVWANDLWVSADDNWSRVQEAGLENRICPIRAEAHALPYAQEFFDAVVSIDSYQYYGTDDSYLAYITRFLKRGGQMGLVVPGLMQPIEEGNVPEHLVRRQANGAVFWDPTECWTLHTADWWRRHLKRSGILDFDVVEPLEDGWKLWLEWERIRDGGGFSGFPSDAETIEADGGRFLGFVTIVARVRHDVTPSSHHSLLVRL